MTYGIKSDNAIGTHPKSASDHLKSHIAVIDNIVTLYAKNATDPFLIHSRQGTIRWNGL